MEGKLGEKRLDSPSRKLPALFDPGTIFFDNNPVSILQRASWLPLAVKDRKRGQTKKHTIRRD